MRCLLLGNYGVGNIGDETLRQYFLRAFPACTWSILSADPCGKSEVPRLPFGIRSFFTPWWKTVIAFLRADAIVFGGGSLFTDSESVFACFLWWWHGFVAWVFRKPLLLAFQGVGPFRTKIGEKCARFVFERAQFISVRDAASLQRMQVWNLSCKPVLTFDPVFSLFSLEKAIASSRSLLVIIPRANSGEEFFVVLSSILQRKFDAVKILLLQPGSEEQAIAHRIQAMLSCPSSILAITSVDSFLQELSGASDVFTERYHGALAALAMGIPTTICSQVSGDKLDELRRMNGSPQERLQLLEKVQIGEEALKSVLFPVRS